VTNACDSPARRSCSIESLYSQKPAMSIRSCPSSPSGSSPGGSPQRPHHQVQHPARTTTRFHVLWILVTSIAVTTFFHVGTAVWQQHAAQLPAANAPNVSSYHHADQQSHAPPGRHRLGLDGAAQDEKRLSLRENSAASSVEGEEEECPTLDASSKPVPTFVLAGAQKAGTVRI